MSRETGSRWKVVALEVDCPLNAETCEFLEAQGCELVHVTDPDPDLHVRLCRDADGVLTFLTPVTATMLSQMEQCKGVVRLGVGYDSVNFRFAREKGIPVSNVPDYCMGEVADHAMALVLALLRGLPTLTKTIENGGWWPQLPFPMRSSAEVTLGIIGLGRIGRAVLERAKPFQFRLVAHDPYLSQETFEALGVRSLSLEEILQQADILTLHTPLTPETRHLINTERLALMKPSALLVNTARGKVVDTFALADALASRRLGGAGIDVFEEEPLPSEHPLRTTPNTLLTPHWAWHSAESELRLHRMGAEELLRGLRGEPLRSCINL